LPSSFQDFLVAHVAAKVAAKNETNIWSGVTANAGEFDGFATLLAADAALPAAQEVAGTTVTASNVVAELGKIVDAIPAALYGNEGLYLYVSQNIARAYVRALGGFGASGLGANGTNALGTQWYNNGSLSFDGVKIFVANGMAANKAIATTKDNLFFGTGLLTDHTEVKVIDFQPYLPQKKQRVVMSARSQNQKTYLQKLQNDETSIVFAIGPAGTGKTMLAVMHGIKLYQEGLVDKIIVTRPAVSVD
jgi:hypothetical protein